MDADNLVTRMARFSLDRKVTMLVLFLTIVAVGVISTGRLPLEMNPRGLEGHYMSVNVRWNVGVPPETMDKIGLPLEEELSTLREVVEEGFNAADQKTEELRQEVDASFHGTAAFRSRRCRRATAERVCNAGF